MLLIGNQVFSAINPSHFLTSRRYSVVVVVGPAAGLGWTGLWTHIVAYKDEMAMGSPSLHTPSPPHRLLLLPAVAGARRWIGNGSPLSLAYPVVHSSWHEVSPDPFAARTAPP
jgi:hypothetical protein